MVWCLKLLPQGRMKQQLPPEGNLLWELKVCGERLGRDIPPLGNCSKMLLYRTILKLCNAIWVLEMVNKTAPYLARRLIWRDAQAQVAQRLWLPGAHQRVSSAQLQALDAWGARPSSSPFRDCCIQPTSSARQGLPELSSHCVAFFCVPKSFLVSGTPGWQAMLLCPLETPLPHLRRCVCVSLLLAPLHLCPGRWDWPAQITVSSSLLCKLSS